VPIGGSDEWGPFETIPRSLCNVVGWRGFDPATSFAGEESTRYDAVSVRGDAEHTVARFDATSWRHISVYARAIGRDD